MLTSSVTIVLVRPARAGNVAAACRALKNMGLHALRLVEPLPDLEDPRSRALAYGAWDVLDGASVSSSLDEAVADCTLLVATTGRPSPGAWSPRRLAEEAGARGPSERLAVVFGPEASGLTRAELQRCHACVHIPAAAAHPSLNLAQAVLIVAYELSLACRAGAASQAVPERASVGELEAALGQLRDALLDIGYLDPRNPDAVLAELRRLVARAAPTPREVCLLRGLARQIGWAGRVARGGPRNR